MQTAGTDPPPVRPHARAADAAADSTAADRSTADRSAAVGAAPGPTPLPGATDGARVARTERLVAATGIAASLSVGVAAFIGALSGSPAHVVPGSWWVAYGFFVAVFVLDSEVVVGRPPRLPRWALPLVEVVTALAVWFLDPAAGWSSILFVVTAVSCAYELSVAATAAVIALQSVAVAAGGAMNGAPTAEVVLTTVLYGAFQAFAALLVVSGRREAEGRAALAAAHADLRAASALLAASTRDAERLRISRDLHDVVGHELTALALELEVASHRVEGEAAVHVERARRVAKDLLRNVRATVSDLRGEIQGLESALRDVIDHVPGLGIDLAVDERGPVDRAHAVVVVRCVQEVLTNTLRHSGATHLRIRVEADDDGVTLTTRDDGQGARRLVLGNGLTGMAERVEEQGGQITVDPGPATGFGVTVRIPVA